MNLFEIQERQLYFQRAHNRIQNLRKLIYHNTNYQAQLITIIQLAKNRLQTNQKKLRNIDAFYTSVKNRSVQKPPKQRLVSNIPFYQKECIAKIPQALYIEKFLRKKHKQSAFFTLMCKDEIKISSLIQKYAVQLPQRQMNKYEYLKELLQRHGKKQIIFHQFSIMANYYKQNFLIDNSSIIGIDVHKIWLTIFIKDQRSQNINNKIKCQKNHSIKTLKFIPWKQEQTNILIKNVEIFGNNWPQIALELQPRQPQQLAQLWKQNICPKIQKGKWSLNQDLKSLILYQYYGNQWSIFSQYVQSRNDIQIRQRIRNVLDPNLVKNNWTKNQDQLLLKLAPMYNYKWSKIIQHFGKKTDNSLWRRFKKLISNLDEQNLKRSISNQIMLRRIQKYKKKKKSQSK